MLTRTITKELLELSTLYPVVTLTGPRQSGKTTLARATFPNKPYVNLEAPDIRALAQKDPRAFLEQYPDGAILDEIQRAPELTSYIQVIVDEKNIAGMYILTGSYQLALTQEVSQSLAGRTGLLNLMPLSLEELKNQRLITTIEQQIFTGGYPRIYNSNLLPRQFYRDYVQTYLERDVRQIVNVQDLTQFQRFIQLCATRIGRVLDMTSIANELGIARTTVKYWLSILEASFIIFRLQPYFENLGKRIIKSPKLYFNDTGLASHLLGIEDSKQLITHPLRGELFENLVVTELRKARLNRGFEPRLYYYRDSNQNEIDLIFQTSAGLVPIEIKSSKTFHKRFLKTLKLLKTLAGERCQKGYVIYGGEMEQKICDFELINYLRTAEIVL
jgi:predicted AAA+ superfamily ATPase